jgi:hypothetical protein
MIRIADRGDAEREDTGCGVLYGILRDSAYKILKLAEEEKQRHLAKGWWQEDCFDSTNGQGGPMHSQTDNYNQKEEN